MNQEKPRIKIKMQGGKMLPVSASYEGASSTKRMATKGGLAMGPNAPLSRSLPVLQSRSRNAIRNNAYAQGARDSYVSNLIGNGIRPDWKNADIQALWNIWQKQSDADGVDSFYGLQSLIAGAEFEAGEVLTRFRFRRPGDGLAVPLQLQLIESEHLDPAFSVATASSLIKMGVEFSGIGQRTAYHLWKFHPHEKLTRELNSRVAVPADNIIHVFRRTRPGQLRGVPALTSVIVRLYEIDEMQDAMLARQKLAQLFGAFIKKKSVEADDDRAMFGTQASLEGDSEALTEFTPGAIHYLEDDEEVTFSDPPDIGASYGGWLRGELLAVAKGAGVTYEQLTGDLKGVNYSSIRAGLLEFRRRAEALQGQLIIQQWCHPVAAKFLDTAVVAGAITLADYWTRRDEYLAINWIAPKWSWIDPLKEVTADLLEVRAGFAARSDKGAERGYSLEELDALIKASNASADDHGMVLDSDPRRTTKAGLSPARDLIPDYEFEENYTEEDTDGK